MLKSPRHSHKIYFLLGFAAGVITMVALILGRRWPLFWLLLLPAFKIVWDVNQELEG